jgi:DNA-binding transcriptional ArsR family regulator
MMAANDQFDDGLLKALGHPLRLRILEAIADAGESSPVVLARAFDRPLATVSHHVRLLRELGFIELVRTEPRRGAVEHYYRAVQRPFLDDGQWQQLPRVMRRGLARQIFRTTFDEASIAGGDGAFDERGAHLIRLPVELDEAGRRELSEAVAVLLKQVEAIQVRTDARRSSATGADGPLVSSSLVVLHYRAVVAPTPRGPEQEGRQRPLPRPALP